MFTTVGKVKQDSGLFGLSIKVIEKGTEVTVEKIDDNFFQVISGRFRGIYFKKEDLDFDLPLINPIEGFYDEKTS